MDRLITPMRERETARRTADRAICDGHHTAGLQARGTEDFDVDVCRPRLEHMWMRSARRCSQSSTNLPDSFMQAPSRRASDAFEPAGRSGRGQHQHARRLDMKTNRSPIVSQLAAAIAAVASCVGTPVLAGEPQAVTIVAHVTFDPNVFGTFEAARRAAR
jgi:hypothetical protein